MAPNPLIVAQASAPGRAGVAVLRLSGSGLAAFAQRLCGIEPQPRHAHLVDFRDRSGQLLDRGLLLWFPAPHSYTGEEVLELHTHGGEVAPRRVLRACLALGARIAEPGEFTRRAFENGKLDLAQAEAVGDLIEAGSEAAARSALRSLSGEFSRRVRAIQQQLTTLRVQAEGALDFPEEELPLQAQQRQREAAQALGAEVEALIQEGQRGQTLRNGRQVVLLGAPNVGKSSLLNRLAGEDLAIVSPLAGTTRDAVRGELELQGLRLVLVDTAGVRADAGGIEQLGIERTWAAVARADLVIRLWSCQQPDVVPPGSVPPGVAVLEVFNKVDLLDPAARQRLLAAPLPVEVRHVNDDAGGELAMAAAAGAAAAAADGREAPGRLLVSALTGEGIAGLEQAILQALGWSESAEPAFLARERHLEALSKASTYLSGAAASAPEELFAEELRQVQRALDDILGEFAADELLGEIFARFCIGK